MNNGLSERLAGHKRRSLDDNLIGRRELLGGIVAATGLAAAGRIGLGQTVGSGSGIAAMSAGADRPVASTTLGKIRGYVQEGINGFKGIPYGDDTAKHRFKAPVPAKAWTDVLETVEFGYMPVQSGGGAAGRGRGRGGIPAPASRGDTPSEDCLNLNVWTQGLRDGKKRPVMVYFHGGAYNSGSVNSDLYDGVRLAKRADVVVVTVNGRLNGFGFLYLADLCGPAYAQSGNAGMLDLVLALQWVHDNIAEFGGDPGTVLIFGQSGGGAKCSTLTAMPAARGLFHRVITMSGQQITGRTREHATADATATLANLGITPDQIGKIDTLTTQQIAAGLKGSWTPVTDGTVLPRDPFSPDASPLSADIPMIKGNTREETAYLIKDPSFATITWDALPAALTSQVGIYLGDLDPAKVVADYRKWYPEYSAPDAFYAITTAARSWKSMLVESEARAKQKGAPFYVYELDWKSPVTGRTPHTLDIPLALDTVAAAAQDQTGIDAASQKNAQQMSDLLSDSFVAFARTGNPDTPALPHWPPYDLTKRSTMMFDTKPRIEDDPRGNQRRLFAPIVYVQPGT